MKWIVLAAALFIAGPAFATPYFSAGADGAKDLTARANETDREQVEQDALIADIQSTLAALDDDLLTVEERSISNVNAINLLAEFFFNHLNIGH